MKRVIVILICLLTVLAGCGKVSEGRTSGAIFEAEPEKEGTPRAIFEGESENEDGSKANFKEKSDKEEVSASEQKTRNESFPSEMGELPEASVTENKSPAELLGMDLRDFEETLSAEDYEALTGFFPLLMEGAQLSVIHCTELESNGEFHVTTYDEFHKEAYSMTDLPSPPPIDSFALCDLDQDGEKELILAFQNYVEPYLILHRDGEGFQGVVMYIRWFIDLQTNGVFTGSGGAATNYYYRMTFEDGSVQNRLIAMEDGWDARVYQIGEAEVDEDEFYAWKESNLPGAAVWYGGESGNYDY